MSRKVYKLLQPDDPGFALLMKLSREGNNTGAIEQKGKIVRSWEARNKPQARREVVSEVTEEMFCLPDEDLNENVDNNEINQNVLQTLAILWQSCMFFGDHNHEYVQ